MTIILDLLINTFVHQKIKNHKIMQNSHCNFPESNSAKHNLLEITMINSKKTSTSRNRQILLDK